MPAATIPRRGGGRPRNLTRREQRSPEYEAHLEREARASDRRNASSRNPMRPMPGYEDPDTPDEGDWSRPPGADDPTPAPSASADDADSDFETSPGPGPGLGRRLFGGRGDPAETGGGIILGALGYALLMSLINYGASGPSAWLKAKFLNKPTPIPGKASTTAAASSAPASSVVTL